MPEYVIRVKTPEVFSLGDLDEIRSAVVELLTGTNNGDGAEVEVKYD